MREGYEMEYASVPREIKVTPERREAVEAIALHDCENYLKDLYVNAAERKIAPSKCDNAIEFAAAAMKAMKITKGEIDAYCEAFEERYLLGYPVKEN